VPLHDVLDDRQTQPGAAGIARAAAVHAVKAFGDARQVLFGDTGIGIAEEPVSRTSSAPPPSSRRRQAIWICPPAGV
jgi:hypothetical protein